MTSDKVRLASVGLGWWGEVLADATGRSGAGEIVTCFARTEESRRAFARKHGCREAKSFEQILADPEVEGIFLATPHTTHTEMIRQAASAGKHIFVEKPFTLTVADAKRAIKAAAKAGVVLQVGHLRRRMGATRRIREMIDRGEMGTIHQIEANFSMPSGQNPKPGWRENRTERPLGGMTGLGVHMVDNFHYLAGPAKRVFAFSKKLFGASNLDDVTAVALEFESGPLGYLGTSIVIPKLCNLAAYGTEANAWSEKDGSRFFFQKKGESDRQEQPVDAVDAEAEEVAEFARCIREGGSPETGGPEGMEVVAVLEALIESVNTGKAVELSQVRD